MDENVKIQDSRRRAQNTNNRAFTPKSFCPLGTDRGTTRCDVRKTCLSRSRLLAICSERQTRRPTLIIPCSPTGKAELCIQFICFTFSFFYYRRTTSLHKSRFTSIWKRRANEQGLVQRTATVQCWVSADKIFTAIPWKHDKHFLVNWTAV